MPHKSRSLRLSKRGNSLLVTFSTLLVVISIGFIGYRLQNMSGAAAAWTTVFQEDFNGTTLSPEWQIDKGTGYEGGPLNGFGTDEIEVMTDNPANLSVANGNLVLTPIRDVNGGWTSGRIETNKVFKPADGNTMHVESRLQFPAVHGAESLGYWPAFWAMGETQRANRWLWPANGEFDFAESVNGINKNWSTLHCGFPASWGGPCNEPNGISNGGIAPVAGNIWGEYHLYGFEWDRTRGTGNDQLRWYVDNSLTHTVNQTDPAVKDVWGTMTSHNGYFIILNMAIGGQFPANQGGGPTAATKSGVPMLVDYVKVLNRVGDGTTPTPSPSPTPTPSTSPTPSPTTTPSPTPGPNPSPTPAPTQPPSGLSTSITAPANNTTVTSTSIVSITAIASGATRVDFLVDGVLMNTDTVAPYTYPWNATGYANGTHVLTTKAFNAAGATVTSAPINVNIGAPSPTPAPTPSPGDTTPPAVSITAPTTGSTITFSDAIVADNFKATATDNVGVTKVEFYDGATLLGTDTTSPYARTWVTSAAGAHTLTTKAYDAAGNSKVSTAVNITAIISPMPTPPPVGINGDVNGDGRVNALDLSVLISKDGQNYAAADFNKDGTVGAADMAVLLGKWTW